MFSEEDFMTVQITIGPRALVVAGFGKTIFESQENAALNCLTRLKSMLKE